MCCWLERTERRPAWSLHTIVIIRRILLLPEYCKTIQYVWEFSSPLLQKWGPVENIALSLRSYLDKHDRWIKFSSFVLLQLSLYDAKMYIPLVYKCSVDMICILWGRLEIFAGMWSKAFYILHFTRYILARIWYGWFSFWSRTFIDPFSCMS